MPTGPSALPPQQLTLFDDAVASLAPASAAPSAAAPSPPTQATPDVGAHPRAGEATAVPGLQASPATPGLEFRHPRSHRELLLAGHRVAYELRRSRRRSIGFVIAAQGLSVSAPRWVGLAEIEAALREKSAWILRKLQEQRERDARLQAARVEWREGGTIPFLGETVILVLDPRTTGAVLHGDATALPGVPGLTLHLGLPQAAQADQIRDAVQSWLQRQARRIFEERCALFTQRLGVRMTRLTLSSAATRWGSASADGSIRLNWRLVHFGLPVIDYVVTHELAHLREMNHGPAFWDVVRSALPDYEQARGVLRHELLPLLE